MIRCALCGRDGQQGYETMPAGVIDAMRAYGYIGGERVALEVAYLWVCKSSAACRRRRGLRP